MDYSGNSKDLAEYEDEDSERSFFFNENPYAGLRVQQSGTMGNDLYVKNSWIVGGLFHSGGGGDGSNVSSLKKQQHGDKLCIQG